MVETVDMRVLWPREVHCHRRNKNWPVISIFYEPLKMSVADILSLLKDRANGGGAPF
jgi:hypothetical protein